MEQKQPPLGSYSNPIRVETIEPEALSWGAHDPLYVQTPDGAVTKCYRDYAAYVED